MTVASTTSLARNDYTGDGSTTAFNFTFPVLQESNRSDSKSYSIKVIITENGIDTVKTETTDYTVTLDEDTRLGTITFGTAPTATQKITFVSDVDVSQATDYNNIGTGAFPADSHEKALDKLTILFRQFLEKESRAISLPESSNLSNIDVPVSAENANKALVVNNAGDNIEVQNLADIGAISVSEFIKTLIDDQTSQEARETLSIDRRVTVDNANYTILDTDKVVAQIGTMSATRIFSLPTASTVQAGAEIIIIDESGSVDATNKIIVQRNGADTIDGLTSEEIITSYGLLILSCNGTNAWKVKEREILDQDDLSSDSSLKTVSQQSVKAYVDNYHKSGFSAVNTGQTIASAVTTKVQFDTKEWDLNNEYDDSTNYRFTPTIAGKYLVNFTGRIEALGTGKVFIVKLYKNGINFNEVKYIQGGNDDQGSTVSTIVDFNGTTDYVEAYIFHNYGSNRNTEDFNKFSAQLLYRT